MKALLLAPMGSVHRRFNKANIEALLLLGYEVHLVANFEDGEGTEKQNSEYVAHCVDEGIITHSVHYSRHSLKESITRARETRELLQKEHFDIVHAHTETGGLILRLAGKPYQNTRHFYTPHGMSFYKGSSLKSQLLYRPVEHWICSGMDTNIAINKEEFAVLNNWNHNSATFVHGIGLDLNKFLYADKERRSIIRKTLGIPENAILITSVGELDDNKNHQVVLRALSQIHNESIYYLICGVGPNENKLKELANNLGLGKQIILAGYRKDIPEVLHASDLFVFPSFHEGLPVSLLEAMAVGLPVICSEIRGNVDLIKDGLGGYLFSPYNESALANILQKTVNSSSICEKMGEINLINVEKYTKDTVMKELTVIYK